MGTQPVQSVRNSQRGSILVALVCALIMVGLVVVGVVYLGAREQELARFRVESAQAVYAANAAANMSMQEIADNTDYDGGGTVGSVAGGVVASGPTVNTAHCAAAVSLSGQTYTITATGSTTRASHVYQLVATRTNGATTAGVDTQCFDLGGVAPGSVGNVNWAATPGWVGVMRNVALPHLSGDNPYWRGGPNNKFAMRCQSTITIPTAGTWTFYVYSDDGSKLYINNTQVVNNDGDHSPSTASGTIVLAAGTATFDLKFFENGGETALVAYWSGPGVASQTIIPSSAFACAPTITIPPLVGVTSVTLNGNGSMVFDGFDARNGVYGGANVLTTGIVTQTNGTAASSISVTNATLNGNAVCGVGGTAGTAITTGAGGSITGSKTAATSGVAVMTTDIPPGMPASAGDQTFSGTMTINANYRVNNMSVTGGTITISGNVIGEVDGNFAMSSNASIQVLPGSSLTLYVGGTFTMANTSTLNTSAGDPRATIIYMIGAAKAMTLNDSSQVCAYTYNNAGGLSIVGGTTPAPEYFGVFHGTTVNLQSNAKFHADVSVGATTGTTGGTSLTQWTRVQ